MPRPIARHVLALLAILAVAGSPWPGSAGGVGEARAAGFLGYDLSWPNCSASIPAAAGFAVVGVTGGLPFKHNPCLRTEFGWARRAGNVAYYINVDAPIGPTTRRGEAGPAGSGCRASRPLCRAYDYGWNTARDAWTYAARTVGVANLAHAWWLDVELGRWSTDRSINARTVKGALDFLRSKGRRAGVYSTDYQWGTIAGSYRPGVDAWYATVVRTKGAAARYCDSRRYAFTGGSVRIVQYQPDGVLDADYRCPG